MMQARQPRTSMWLPEGGPSRDDVKVEVRRLLLAAIVHCASWRQPDQHLHQVCRHVQARHRLCSSTARL